MQLYYKKQNPTNKSVYSIYLVAADAKYVFSFEHPQVATSIQKTGLVILHYALLLHLETATLSNTWYL